MKQFAYLVEFSAKKKSSIRSLKKKQLEDWLDYVPMLPRSARSLILCYWNHKDINSIIFTRISHFKKYLNSYVNKTLCRIWGANNVGHP